MRGAERKEEPPILPPDLAASAYSGATTSETKTLPATIAASAMLNAGLAFWVSHSSSFLRAATGARRARGDGARDGAGPTWRGRRYLTARSELVRVEKFEINGAGL